MRAGASPGGGPQISGCRRACPAGSYPKVMQPHCRPTIPLNSKPAFAPCSLRSENHATDTKQQFLITPALSRTYAPEQFFIFILQPDSLSGASAQQSPHPLCPPLTGIQIILSSPPSPKPESGNKSPSPNSRHLKNEIPGTSCKRCREFITNNNAQKTEPRDSCPPRAAEASYPK